MVPIISVTGTKGKTTVVGLVSDILGKLHKNVLRVDTTGHYAGGVRKSTYEDSKRVWGLLPTRAPGRYLWEFYENAGLAGNGVAVLECSIGCSVSGLGYGQHDVGVFLNVFEDHMGRPGLETRHDLAVAKKSFILGSLKDDGAYAVVNADDSLVMDMYQCARADGLRATLLPVGVRFDYLDVALHLESGGSIVTVDSAMRAVVRSKGSDLVMADLTRIPITFDGSYEPGVINALFACAAIYAYYHGVLPAGVKDIIESVELPRGSGRMIVLKANNGAELIVDYAHESHSITAVAKLARSRAPAGGKLVGVVRLGHRTNGLDLLKDAARAIHEGFDTVVLYDKWDYDANGHEGAQAAKAASRYVLDALRGKGANAHYYPHEKDAVQYAATICQPDDEVVIIVNDNVEKSLSIIKEQFRIAED